MLLIAPTGGGKTLAGFLPTLVELSERGAKAARRSSRPAATSSAREGSAHALHLAAEGVWPSILPAISKRRSPKWACRSGSRRAPATRPFPKRTRQRKDPPDILADARRSNWRCCCASADAPYLFGTLKRVILDELHALVLSKRGDLLSLDLARLFRLAPGPAHDRICRQRWLIPMTFAAISCRSRAMAEAMADLVIAKRRCPACDDAGAGYARS